ncbi:MAG: hypothetical protein Sylvanvirus8_4 [Sylvanvirus sp.]|uniref:DUF7666 domain-containing protein n=1 Tax=Sylvanvirus sp. TaxID=2487774 RepID=A0A3G5AHW0_9VIRU|nr:MAG: hypothetical protein Sylvanvirus8_4 [Sylvanvirus sp.]
MVTKTRSQTKKESISTPKARQISGYKAFYKGMDKYGVEDVYFGHHQTYTLPGGKLVGKKFRYNGKALPCQSGYHYIPKENNILHVLDYYNPPSEDVTFKKMILTEVCDHGERAIDGDKATTNDLEIIREFTEEETKKALTGILSENSVTKYFENGFQHRNETEGPAQLNLSGTHCYFYMNKGVIIRQNGPAVIYMHNDTIEFRFKTCKWVKDGFKKIDNINIINIFETEKALIAPEHEWDAVTCGEGNCWQWNHNPQRYELGHTKPPKCMFTQVLPDGYRWEWSLMYNDWYIYRPIGHYLYLDNMKRDYENGEKILLSMLADSIPIIYKFEY